MLSKTISNKFNMRSYCIAKLRNAEFTKCKFNNLTFINNEKPITSKEEGYHIRETRISVGYNGFGIGGTTGFLGNYAIYDNELHKSYRIYTNDKDYVQGNIYDNVIHRVKFINSVIELSNINKITFSKTDFDNTELLNNTFNGTIFEGAVFSESYIADCNFSDVQFAFKSNCTFTDTTFEKVIFTNSMLETCIFHNCVFRSCTFDKVTFHQCVFGCEFLDCVFNSVSVDFCRIQYNSSIRFSEDKFKMLCDKWCKFDTLVIE